MAVGEERNVEHNGGPVVTPMPVSCVGLPSVVVASRVYQSTSRSMRCDMTAYRAPSGALRCRRFA